MSFSYRVLAVAFAGVLVIVGFAGILDGGDSGGSVAGASATTATNAPASTSTPAIAAASTSAPAVATVEDTTVDDTTVDDTTDQAVRSNDGAVDLGGDGVVGRQKDEDQNVWVGPSGPLQATNEDCPVTGHGAILDRANQWGALCAGGVITHDFPITSAVTQPDPGTYPVYAKDLQSSSNFGGHFSTMTHFVSFAEGKNTGARIAFHSVPKFSDGTWVQPLDTVGSEAYHGESSGCIRVLPDHAVLIWDWLSIGDEVNVIS